MAFSRLALGVHCLGALPVAADEPLLSWNDGPAKQATG